jgi:hypothetical protein
VLANDHSTPVIVWAIVRPLAMRPRANVRSLGHARTSARGRSFAVYGRSNALEGSISRDLFRSLSPFFPHHFHLPHTISLHAVSSPLPPNHHKQPPNHHQPPQTTTKHHSRPPPATTPTPRITTSSQSPTLAHILSYSLPNLQTPNLYKIGHFFCLFLATTLCSYRV